VLLRSAFEHLAEQRDISEITIRDITDHANLGRATFYLHYQKKDDLIAELLDTLVEEMRVALAFSSEALADAVTGRRSAEAPPNYSGPLELLDLRKPLYRSLAHSSAGLEFWNRIQHVYRDAFLHALHRTGKVPAPGSPSFEYRALYASGGVRAIVLDWLERPDAPRAEVGSQWTRYINLFLLTENVVDPDEIASANGNDLP
jgi:AcrR family transcriptional regulator